MAGYKIDGAIPFLVDDDGKLLGYVDRLDRERHIDGSAFNRANPDPIAAISERLNKTEKFSGTRPSRISVLGNSLCVDGLGGWFFEISAKSGGMLEIDSILGVSGNTTAHMLARVSNVPNTSDYCFVLEGPNDAGGSVSPAQHGENMRRICAAISEKGVIPVICLSSLHNTYPAQIAAYRMVEYFISQKNNIRLVDPFGGQIDPATGGWVSGASIDGVHPVSAAEKTAGIEVFDQIRGASFPSPVRPKHGAWAGQVSNNLFLASSGGLATSWIKLGSGVASITPAASDGFLGNYQVLTATGLTANTSVYADVVLPAGYAETDEWLVHAGMKFVNTSNCKVSLYVRWRNSGGGGIRDDAFVYQISSPVAARTWQRTLKAPLGTASAQLQLQLSSDAGGAFSGEASIAEAVVCNITRLAAL